MRRAEQIRYLILAAQREGNRQLSAALAQLGLTPAQSEALRILEDHGPLALKQLGDMLVCDTGTSPSTDSSPPASCTGMPASTIAGRFASP